MFVRLYAYNFELLYPFCTHYASWVFDAFMYSMKLNIMPHIVLRTIMSFFQCSKMLCGFVLYEFDSCHSCHWSMDVTTILKLFDRNYRVINDKLYKESALLKNVRCLSVPQLWLICNISASDLLVRTFYVQFLSSSLLIYVLSWLLSDYFFISMVTFMPSLIVTMLFLGLTRILLSLVSTFFPITP